ncbi:MAG TPA: BamA/TamA family outer membrane protein [Verrucomicrobiota bacterium]|nr:BamA/TamA family outer membrane protein [Verrucomicrobiota bacterium]
MNRAPLHLILALLLAVAAAPLRAAETQAVQLHVKGCGILENHRMLKMLRLLKSDAVARDYFDAADVEDSVLILAARLRDEGFLSPDIQVWMRLNDGTQLEESWNGEFHARLPRNMKATVVKFQIEPGVRFYFKEVEFEGLSALPETVAHGYFMGTDFLLKLKRTRIYTPAQLTKGVRAIVDALQQRGYEDAQVTVASIQRDDESGAVKARIEVKEGLRTLVRSVRQEVFMAGADTPSIVTTNHPGDPYSRFWQQTYAQELQREFYRQGYPDAKVFIENKHRDEIDGEYQLDLVARVETGERVTLSGVKFIGAKHTKPFVMERRAALATNEWLDRVETEQARFRLSRLGIFRTVNLEYEPTNGPSREAVFEVREDRRTDLSLLFGYGSYELLRGGIELDQRNLFGLAHHSRLRLVQSFKSSSAGYSYTIPDLLPGQTDVSGRGSYLRREEIDFTREEYGGGIGAQRFLPWIKSHIGLRLNYGRVQALDVDAAAAEDVGPTDSIVSSWVFDFSHDQRDNPLYPRRGWNLAFSSETAAHYFGGDVNYERLELTGSYHHSLGGGRWLHFGAAHGAALAFGSAEQQLPFNMRYFPGGADSIRGYQQDQASPRDANGDIIGAATYMLGNFELEQALTPSWSLVVFFDALGIAEDIGDYPFDEGLYSVGGGIRWRTVVGPVRLEYGHNLNPRHRDPSGTLHFSIGFPF